MSLVLHKNYQNNTSVIYCNFCRKFYSRRVFSKHLASCKNFILYNNQVKLNHLLKQKKQLALTWKKKKNLTTPKTLSFSDYLKNKRVIVIGPSITTEECELGDFIEKFDIVVRLNKSLPVPPEMWEHIGKRTDILYNSLNTSDYPGQNKFHPSFLKRNGVKYLRCSYPMIRPFLKDILSFKQLNRGRIPFSCISASYYTKIETALKTRPYTGTCAIADLLQHPLKELYVMGIDFYTYKYYFKYRYVTNMQLEKLKNNSIHKKRPQIQLLQRFMLLDKRFVTDVILTDILLEKYDAMFNYIFKIVNYQKIFISAEGVYDFFNHVPADSKVCFTQKKDVYDFETFKDIQVFLDLFPTHTKKNMDILIQKKKKKIICCYYDEKHIDKKNDKNKIILLTKIFKIPLPYKNKNVYYVNPLFVKVLNKLIYKYNIFYSSSLSFEIFVVFIFSIFLPNCFVHHVNLNNDWLMYNGKSRKEHIEKRLLFKYLLKRQKIKNITQ